VGWGVGGGMVEGRAVDERDALSGRLDRLDELGLKAEVDLGPA